jgi:predicted RNA binding protein YcfA (HicA-like mRNA interferase family)
MAPKFPDADYRDISVIAKKLGFYFYREAKGSHEIWRRDRDGRQTTIPHHAKKSLKRKTLKSILVDFGISSEEFIRLKHH